MSSHSKELAVATKYYGQVITNVKYDSSEIVLYFANKWSVRLFDDGQSCCESRYMVIQDNVNDLIGSKLTLIEIVDCDNIDDEYGTHEIQFLRIHADENLVSVSSHNEHNGYYGGIYIECQECVY